MFRRFDVRSSRIRLPATQRRCTRVAAAASLLLSAVSVGACAGDPAELRLIVLISVDTLRADRLGVYGGGLELTPNLDALAETSVVFETAYAPTSFTLPSVSALLTGRYPEEIGVLSNRSAVGASVPTLATGLRDAGWRTGAVVSNFVLRANSGLAVGFDRYDDALPAREAVRDWPDPGTDRHRHVLLAIRHVRDREPLNGRGQACLPEDVSTLRMKGVHVAIPITGEH